MHDKLTSSQIIAHFLVPATALFDDRSVVHKYPSSTILAFIPKPSSSSNFVTSDRNPPVHDLAPVSASREQYVGYVDRLPSINWSLWTQSGNDIIIWSIETPMSSKLAPLVLWLVDEHARLLNLRNIYFAGEVKPVGILHDDLHDERICENHLREVLSIDPQQDRVGNPIHQSAESTSNSLSITICSKAYDPQQHSSASASVAFVTLTATLTIKDTVVHEGTGIPVLNMTTPDASQMKPPNIYRRSAELLPFQRRIMVALTVPWGIVT